MVLTLTSWPLAQNSHPSGLLDGLALVAAAGDGPQDVLQVNDVCQDAADVQVDLGQLAPLGGLLVLHVLEPRPQSVHRIFLSGHRLLQLLQLCFIHLGLVCGEQQRGEEAFKGKMFHSY